MEHSNYVLLCGNLHECFRRLRLVPEDSLPPTKEDVYHQLNSKGFFVLQGERRHGVLFQHTDTPAVFRDNITNHLLKTSTKIDTLLLVLDDIMLHKKTIIDTIRAAEEKNKTVRYVLASHRSLATKIPDAACVPTHRILDEDSFQAYIKRERLTEHGIPTIIETDPPLVWIGARPGDRVEIERISENAGIGIAIRTVIPLTTKTQTQTQEKKLTPNPEIKMSTR